MLFFWVMAEQQPTTTGESGLSAQAAIARFEAKELDGAHLLFYLMYHDAWLVPLQDPPEGQETPMAEDGTVQFRSFKDEAGKVFFNVYSHREALETARKEHGEPYVGDYFLKLPGYALFSFETEEYDYLNLDPAGPNALHYKAEQFPMLRDWARMVGLDNNLRKLLTQQKIAQEDRELVRDFAHYWIVVTRQKEQPDEQRLALAPDEEQNRRLAAIFTGETAVNRYLQWLEGRMEDGVELFKFELKGEELFRELSQMELDGLIFNPQGPLRPLAFSKVFPPFILGEDIPEPPEEPLP